MQVDQERLTALLDRVVGDLSAGYGGVMVRIGDRLGLYAAMAGAGPLTPGEVAARAGCAERYVAEWLNAQAAGGYVEYHPVSGTYELTAEGALVLADPESPVFVPPAWDVPASMFLDSQDTIAAFRTRPRRAVGRPRPGASTRASRASTATPTGRASPPSGSRRSTASRRRSPAAARSPTSAAATATPRSRSPRRSPPRTFDGIDNHGPVDRRRPGARPQGRRDRPGVVPRGRRARTTRASGTTSSASSTPCTTSATRRARSPTPPPRSRRAGP